MQVSSLEDLQDKIDRDFAWRKKELIDFSTVIEKSSSEFPVLCKMGIALLSAHFEGFVKNVSNYYLFYVSSREKDFSELTSNFAAIIIKKALLAGSAISEKSSNITLYKDCASKIIEEGSFRITNGVIDTKSNPTSEVLKNIFDTIGLDFTPYLTKVNYIDSDLLKNRNKAVHGERFEIHKDTFESTREHILEMMDKIAKQIMDSATNENFLKEIT